MSPLTNTTAEDIVLNFDSWLGNQTPEARQGIDAHLKASGPYAEREKKRMAAMFAVSEDTGLDLDTISERWDVVRGGYAEQMAEDAYGRQGDESGGEWMAVRDDEDAFHAKLVQHATKRRDFRIQDEAFASAGAAAGAKLEPGDSMAESAKMLETAKSIEGFSIQDADKFANSYRQARDFMETKVGPYRGAARQIRQLLEEDAGKKAGGSGNPFDAALDVAAALPDDALGLVYRMLDETAPDASGAGMKIGKNIKRGFLDALKGVAGTRFRTSILNAQQALAGGAGSLKIRDGETVRDAVSRLMVANNAATTVELGPYAGLGEAFASGRSSTPAEDKEAQALLDQQLKRHITAGKLLKIEQENVDPATSRDPFARAMYESAYSMGAMAPVFMPQVGVIIAQGSYADAEFQRQVSMGTDPKTAHFMGLITGSIQAGLESLGVGLLKAGAGNMVGKALTKVPWVAKVAKVDPGKLAFGSGVGAAAGRLAGEVGLQQAGEYTEEKAQDAAQIFTAVLAEGMGLSLPEQATVAAEIQRFKIWDPDMYLSLLPITGLFGGGHALLNNKKAQAARDALLANPVAMQAVGASVEDATRVAAMPPQERPAAWQGTALDPSTEAAGQAQAAIKEQQQAKAAQAQVFQEAMKREDITYEMGTRDGQPVYRVTKGEVTTEHADANSAFLAVTDHMDAGDRAANQSGLEMFAALAGRAISPGEMSYTIEGEQRSALEYLQDAEDRAANESLPQDQRDRAKREAKGISDRMDIYEKANPDASTDWSKVYVGGTSTVEQAKEGAFRAVIRVANGASADVVFEEHVEADVGIFVSSGKTTWEALAAMIQEVEFATGDTYLHGFTDGQDRAKDLLVVKEAYSALAQVHVTGQSRAGQRDSTDVAFASRMGRMRERQNLRRAMAGGQVNASLVERLQAYAQWMTAVVSRAIRLHRARRKAGGSFAVDQFLNKSIGLEADVQHANGVVAEAERILPPEGGTPPDVGSFSISVDPSKFAKPPKGVNAIRSDSLPLWELPKDPGQSVPKNALENKASRDKFYARLDKALAKLRKDPASLVTGKGWVKFLRDAGVYGIVPMPPSGLGELLNSPEVYVAKLNGEYHGDRTVPGTQESARAGLNGTAEMAEIIAQNGGRPAPWAVALHHFWGILSRMLAPIHQEALWLRLISQRPILDAIQSSIDGNFELMPEQWEQLVQDGRRETPGAGQIGNAGTSNANSFYDMLSRWNGKWNEVADIYVSGTAAEMGRKFWALGYGKVGIKNKVQRFIGLTFGVPGVIMDRWKFVELWLPTLVESQDSASSSEYFSYGQNTPEDPVGVYGNYGTAEGDNTPLSLAMYEAFEVVMQAAIDRSPSLQSALGAHSNPGGLHWHGWNAIKNEAVGHSSLDITKDLMRAHGQEITAQKVHDMIQEKEYYTEGAETQKSNAKVILRKGTILTERTSLAGGLQPGLAGVQRPGDGADAEGSSGDRSGSKGRKGTDRGRLGQVEGADGGGLTSEETSGPTFSLKPILENARLSHDPNGSSAPARVFSSLMGGNAEAVRPQRRKFGRQLAGIAELTGWAEAEGRILPARRIETEITEPFATGGEHQVWYDESSGRFFKATKPGLFGYQAEDAGAYMQRWALHNQVFGDDVLIEGITSLENDSGARIIISQPAAVGRDATPEELSQYLTEKGFFEHEGRWVHPVRGVAVWDTITPGNAIMTDAGVKVIDLQIGPATKEELAAVKEQSGQGRETSFHLSPIATLDRLAADIDRRKRDPEMRRKIYDNMKGALDTLRRRWTETQQVWNGESPPVVDQKTKRQLDKEQAAVKAQIYADEEETIWTSLGEFDAAALSLTGEDTSAYEGQLAQRFSGGGFGKRGRIIAKGAAMKQAASEGFPMGGEYDGAAGLPSIFFGGSLSADEAAQEAYDAGEIADAYPDTLWAAISSELGARAKLREAAQSAMGNIKEKQKEAMRKAREEAADWRANQDEMQKKDWDSRAVMLRHLRTLDALLSALPPEIRGKVGGWTAVASLSTQKALQKELEHRLAVADEHLEAALKQEAMEAIEALLLRAKPDREAGKRSKGKLGAEGHRFFDEVERVKALTTQQAQAEGVLLEAGFLVEDLEDSEAAAIFEKQQILDMFGALGKPKAHDAAHVTRALDMLEMVYTEKRNRWRILEEGRLAEVKAMADFVTDTLGGVSYAGTQADKKKAAGVIGKLRALPTDLKSFTEVMAALLGEGHPLALRWSRAAREAYAMKNNNIRALRKRWVAALEGATGAKGLKARRMLWDMGNPTNQTIRVNTAGPGISSTQMIPIKLIDKWADGSANPAEMEVSKVEAQEMIDARDALEEGDTKESLPLTRESRGPTETVPMTEAQGIFLTMLEAQEQYRGALDKAGWDAAAMQQIDDQLSDAAKSLRAFLGAEYREGYAPLAKVFERMFGVGLPQIKNYAPAAFYSMGTEVTMNPTGSGTVEGGFRAGFLKNRKDHAAAPKLENAFATFFGHANQTAHWLGMAEVARELSGVFGRPEVKRAIEARHGAAMLGAVNQWIKVLEGNGLQVQAGHLDQFVRWLTTQQSYIALAYKLGTLLKQSSALLGAAYKMPAGAYMKGLSRLIAGKLDTKSMWESDVIQARLESGFAPEVRAALNDIWSAPPSRRAEFLERGMETIGLVDAIFTTGSAAIAYEYHYKQAKADNMTDEVAHAVAMQVVSDIVGATAQPADAVDRSLFELRQGAFGKLIFLFASEARQKSSLWLTAWGHTLTGKATSADIKVLILSHLVVAPMMFAIGAMVRDMKDGDDDEVFDPTNWDPMDFLKACVAGPLAGLPLIGSAVSGFANSGVEGRFVTTGKSLRDIFKGPDDKEPDPAEWYFKRAVKVMQGMDAFTGVVGSVASQGYGMIDNAYDTDNERLTKNAANQRKLEADQAKAREKALPEALKEEAKKQRKAKRQAGREQDAARWRAANP